MMSLSNSARLLRGYMHATGITDAKVIASKLGISIRTIYRLKVDLAEFDVNASSATDGSAKTAISATGGTNESAICAKTAIRGTEASATGATGGTPTCNQQKEIPPTPPKEKLPLPRTTVEIPINVGARSSRRQPRGARLSTDWALPAEWGDWARINFASVNAEQVALEAEKFRDFWLSKPGQSACKLDWQATWRNWCRTAFAPNGRQQAMNWGRNAYDERKASGQRWNEAMASVFGGRA